MRQTSTAAEPKQRAFGGGDRLAFWDQSHLTSVGSSWSVDAVAPELLREVGRT